MDDDNVKYQGNGFQIRIIGGAFVLFVFMAGSYVVWGELGAAVGAGGISLTIALVKALRKTTRLDQWGRGEITADQYQDMGQND